MRRGQIGNVLAVIGCGAGIVSMLLMDNLIAAVVMGVATVTAVVTVISPTIDEVVNEHWLSWVFWGVLGAIVLIDIFYVENPRKASIDLYFR